MTKKNIKILQIKSDLSEIDIENLPINYLTLKPNSKKKLVFMPIETSKFHQTKFFPKKNFYKPISKLL
jgi:hypothetical protein